MTPCVLLCSSVSILAGDFAIQHIQNERHSGEEKGVPAMQQ